MYCILYSLNKCNLLYIFSNLFIPKVKEGPLSVTSFYFKYRMRQDTGIRTRVAATAARWATNELHTSLYIILYIVQSKLRRAQRVWARMHHAVACLISLRDRYSVL